MDPEPVPGELLDRVQALSAEIDALQDVGARELAQELVGAVIAMYGDGLRRIVESIESSHEAGQAIMDQLSQDGAVASLLLIHDLYPVSLRDRVLEALDTVRPYMESHGGNVELLEIEDGVARLGLQGSCNGCAASQATLELAIKQALEDAAPDLAGLEVEGVAPDVTGVALPMADGNRSAQSGLELPVIQAGAAPPAPAWHELKADDEPAPETLVAVTIARTRLVIANVEGSLLAYHDACAACSEPIHDGELVAGALRCNHCGRSFFLPRAGRSIDDERLQLEPVPLLRESDGAKVALAG
jgi:Fe-S cluster biogenesis protein NfuA/nitrite reductase/ring-hydroxylating ferredoxin subunit